MKNYRELENFGNGFKKRWGDADEVLPGVLVGRHTEFGEPPEADLPVLDVGLAQRAVDLSEQLFLGGVALLPRALRASDRR